MTSSASPPGEWPDDCLAATRYVLPDVPDGVLVYEIDRLQTLPVIAIVGDYMFFDQNEASVSQGRQEDAGVNWWISRQWKFGVSWGDADLDRGGTRGRARLVLDRLQWYLP